MEAAIAVPPTLIETIKYFSDPATCVAFMADLRWYDGSVCPRCVANRISFLSTRLIWKCLDCKKQFSVKVRTIFKEGTIGLDKWLCARWIVANCKNSVSSYEISKDLSLVPVFG